MTRPAPRCVCLAGPTACGKSDLALELAAEFPLEIISMDSAMVYRGMDIGTAKPSAEMRAAVPHHLIDILDPSESYSAACFARDAAAAVEQIQARGRLALLVGGTSLYLKAFRDGLSSMPAADRALRQELDAEAARRGWPAMHARLESLDPEAAARISPHDRQRIQRALEVCLLTGSKMSDVQRRGRRPQRRLLVLALMPDDRAALAERIAQRFDAMVASGFVAEVAALRARGDLEPTMPAMRAVGYRQVWSYLDGQYGWEEARRRALAATRQLAKRQMTWLRGDASVQVLPAFAPSLGQQAAQRIRETLSGWD